jgi:hypothetical protein
MRATYTSKEDLERALVKVNKKYENNICFHPDTDLESKPLNFRLWTKSYDKPGYKVNTWQYSYGWSKNCKRHPSACWHVHGHFFEALFEINPNAKVYSNGTAITKDEGNWIEQNGGVTISNDETCNCYQSWPLAPRKN